MSVDHRLRWQETLEKPVDRAAEYLAERTGLSGGSIKRLMNAGGVWLERARQPGKRLRRATAPLQKGDRVRLYYDENLLAVKTAEPVLLDDQGSFSVWFKPAGVLSQGNEWGDQHALLRKAELFFTPRRDVYLVHRLDREAMGLMVIAHTRQAAGHLSQQWQLRETVKSYRVRVAGQLESAGQVLDAPLDGKSALTRVGRAVGDLLANTTLLEVEIETGRKHQIRRHLEAIGHPVMGDPQYGAGNRDPDGLALAAVALGFRHPQSGKTLGYSCPETLLPLKLCWPEEAPA
ncbi:MAG: RluA family pseudouridine synthase [Hahellaceae bacterium]|nr:RluA family pseudouridine synthase [Hahellaceae bacterium]